MPTKQTASWTGCKLVDRILKVIGIKCCILQEVHWLNYFLNVAVKTLSTSQNDAVWQLHSCKLFTS